jgi:uncharacterized protein YhdP
VGVRAWAQTDAPLTAVLDVDRARQRQAWLGADPVDFHAWSPLLAAGGVRLREGKGELNLWLTLRDFAPVALTTDSDLRDVRVDGAPMPGVAAPRLQLQRCRRACAGSARPMAGRCRYRAAAEDRRRRAAARWPAAAGWQAAAGEFRRSAGRHALRALALSDRLEPGLRRWLFLSRPQLDVRELQLAGERDGPLRAQGELQSLGFRQRGNSPGLRGLGGRFRGRRRWLQPAAATATAAAVRLADRLRRAA